MPLNMQPLSDKFGVAITNVDLSKDIDQSLFDEIVEVFVKKQVLVFRSQHIEPQHQVAFSRRFGPLGSKDAVIEQRLNLFVQKTCCDSLPEYSGVRMIRKSFFSAAVATFMSLMRTLKFHTAIQLQL